MERKILPKAQSLLRYFGGPEVELAEKLRGQRKSLGTDTLNANNSVVVSARLAGHIGQTGSLPRS